MAMFVYPKSLLEAWASLGLRGKTARRPVTEAAASDFDGGDDYSDDDLADRDVDAEFGKYDSLVDYEGEDSLGYSEPDTAPEMDKQYSRLGMHVEDIDQATGLPKSDTSERKSKGKTARGDSQKEFRDAIASRRLGDAKALYREISAVAERCLGFYGDLNASGMPEQVRDAANDIAANLNAPMDGKSADIYLSTVLRLIYDMEKLGIAARKNGMVPEGIPENLVSDEHVASLIYLCRPEKSMIRLMSGDDTDSMNMLSPSRLASRARGISQNICGKGKADEPVIPLDPEAVYKGSFAVWENRFKTKAERLADRGMAAASSNDTELSSLAMSNKMNAEHLDLADSKSANAFVPHSMFMMACERIENDKSSTHKKARGSILQEFNNSADLMATYLVLYGPNALKDAYGVHPPRLPGAGPSPCYMSRDAHSRDSFQSSVVCLRYLKETLEMCKTEIARKRAQLVDPAGNVYDELTVMGTNSGTASKHTVGAVEFIDRILESIEHATAKSKQSDKGLVSPELSVAVDRALLLHRKPRKVSVNGEWKMTAGEDIPLFDYFSMDFGKTGMLNMDAPTKASANSDKGNTLTLHDTISSRDVIDSDESGLDVNTKGDYVETLLASDQLGNICTMCGIPESDRPAPDSTEKEKMTFVLGLLLKVSDIMRELGTDSYLARLPGNSIDEVISKEDKERYGRDCSIATVWSNTMRSFMDGCKAAEDRGESKADILASLPPKAQRFVAGPIKAKRLVTTFARHLLNWLNTFQSYEYDSSDLVVSLTGSNDDFEKAKGLLNPYVEMVPLLIAIAGSDTIAGRDGRQSNEYRLAISYISQLQRELGENIFSPRFIESVIKYANSSYNGVSDMVGYANQEAPLDWSSMLEWCTVRFLVSGIDTASGKLVPPDQVGGAPVSGNGTDDSDTGEVPPILEKYRKILAAKPKFLKRDAWLVQNKISPEKYDYLEQQARGTAAGISEDDGTGEGNRIIGMAPADISAWLKNRYMKYGNAGEMILLMLGLIYVGTLVHDSAMQSVTAFHEDSVNENLTDASMHRMVKLTDAISAYGVDYLGRIIGDLVGDDGESLSILLDIIGSAEPLTENELGEMLAPVAKPGEPRTEDSLSGDLNTVIARLSSTPFLVFNGIV